MVSFERVFEVIDLPQDISEKTNAVPLTDIKGAVEFDHVMFRYTVEEEKLLSEVRRYGRMDNVAAVLSLSERETAPRARDEAEVEVVESSTSQARAEALDDVGDDGGIGDGGRADGEFTVVADQQDAVKGHRLPRLDCEAFDFESVAGADAILFATCF